MQVKRTLNFALKRPYLVIFRLELEKTIVLLDFSTINLSNCNISCKKNKKKKKLNVGLNLFYLGIFELELKIWTKIVLIGYFGQEFQKPNTVFEMNILKLVNMQSFIQKQKKHNLGTKNTLFKYLGIFGLQFNKNCCQNFISTLEL